MRSTRGDAAACVFGAACFPTARRKLMLSRDVTELERPETMRRDFVANVSHELQHAAHGAVGFLETMQRVAARTQPIARPTSR